MSDKTKSYIFIGSTSLLFVISFILNITSDTSLYNLDLNTVPDMQNSWPGNHAFIVFMNIISNLFNPVICAGYIALFWLISSRKFQIMIFLVWFILVSWLLTLLKLILQQARPYWIQGSGVQMLQWTCYTQYGLPSGHATLGLVLMEFIVRFFVRGYPNIKKYMPLLYIGILILQILVMFSRVILGMHTYNQVMMGAMWGLYIIAIYYSLIEAQILKYMSRLVHSQQVLTHTIFLGVAMVVCLVIQILLYFLIDFNYDSYWQVINSTQGCSGSKLYKSFQYKCLQDSALIMAAFGLLIGLLWMRRPQNLFKNLAYTRLSCRWLAKFFITILSAVIPLLIFVNPFWSKLEMETSQHALFTWGCQNIGFLIGIASMLLVAPLINQKLGFQRYSQSVYQIDSTNDNLESGQIEIPQVQQKEESNCM